MNENINESLKISQPDILSSDELEKASSVDEKLSNNSVGSNEEDLKVSDNSKEEPESVLLKVKV